MKFTARVTNEGPLGVRLDTWTKPPACPGLGGWKLDGGGGYWTRCKGDLARRILETAQNGWIEIAMDGEHVVRLNPLRIG